MSIAHRRRPVSARRLLVTAALLVAACDDHVGCVPVLRTEAGQLELHDTGAIAGACRQLREPGPLLAGTRLCPTLQCGDDVPGCADDEGEKIEPARVAACFEKSVVGPATIDEAGCVVATGPGEVTWSFAAKPCAAQVDGYVPADDRLVLPVVDLAEVGFMLEAPGDAFALRSTVAADDGPLPEEPRLSAGEVAHVVEGTEVPLAIVLRHPEHAQPVAWNPEAFELEVQAGAEAMPQIARDDLGVVTVAMAAGTTATLSLRQGDAVLPVGEVRGVATRDLVTLEIVAGFAPPQQEGETHGPPVGARAILRTADGTPVYGADVEWNVEKGALPLWRDPSRPWTADYVALGDEEGRTCADPPERTGTRRAVVSATFQDLRAELELAWREPGEDSSLGSEIADLFGRDEEERSPHCDGPGFAPGCGCHEGRRGGGSGPALLVLAGLVLLTRKRPRSSRRTSCSRPCA